MTYRSTPTEKELAYVRNAETGRDWYKRLHQVGIKHSPFDCPVNRLCLDLDLGMPPVELRS